MLFVLIDSMKTNLHSQETFGYLAFVWLLLNAIGVALYAIWDTAKGKVFWATWFFVFSLGFLLMCLLFKY